MSTPEQAEIICISCGRSNSPAADYCVACDAPISARSVYDPFATIRTRGWVFRRSADSPKRPIVVVGIVLLFGPLLLLSLYGLIALAGETALNHARMPWQERLAALLVFVLAAGAAWISGSLILRSVTNYLTYRLTDADDMQDDDDEGDDETAYRLEETDSSDDDGPDDPDGPNESKTE